MSEARAVRRPNDSAETGRVGPIAPTAPTAPSTGKVMPAATARTVLAGGILLLGGIIGVIDGFIQHSAFYFLGIGGATLLVAAFVDGTKLRYRGPGIALLLTFLTGQYAFKWLPDKPWGMTQLEFLGFCYASLFAAYGLYVLIREVVRLRAQSPS